MAFSGIALDGKELLECQLEKLPKALVRAAIRQTSARDKREMAAQFEKKAAGLHTQAEPYLDQAYEHGREYDRATLGVAAIIHYRGSLGKVGNDLFDEAVRHSRERRSNFNLSSSFTTEAEAYEKGAAKLRSNARKDQFMVAVHKTVNVIQSLFHMN